MDNKEVIRRIKNDDKEAFALLYDCYWRKVYNFTKLYITSLEDVEEIVQEVFVKFWESRAFLDESRSPDGLLFIITRNLSFNHSRNNIHEAFLQTTVLESLEDASDVEAELEASELGVYIHSLIEMLPSRQQSVFRLSREEGLTYREIALRLQISERTVEHHISDALKFLKKSLQLYALFVCCS